MDVFDLLLPPIYLFIVLVIAYKYKGKSGSNDGVNKFFIPGLLLKILGAISLGLIYSFYYSGGDTINYHQTAMTLANLMFDNFDNFMYIYFGKPSFSDYQLLGDNYANCYWINDEFAFFVSKCYTPVVLICCKSYFASAIVTASICYIGVWRMYLVFVNEFPALAEQFAWSILFVPSVLFWGSGIMKDSITLSATGLYVYGFYWFFVKKKFKLSYLLQLALGIYLIFSIKPYIFFAIMPGSLIWFVVLRINKVKNNFIRTLFVPLFVVVGFLAGMFILKSIGSYLGGYSLEKIIKTASGSQQDLKQSYYGGNTFNIGDYEPTIAGLLSVSHKAIYASLFRPTIFDVRNVVMLISALENTFILVFCLYLLIRLKVYKFFGLISSHPLLLFSFVFSIFFAFSVGVSVSNFGTLVRLKIPCIPFFLSSLIILNHMLRQQEEGVAKN